MTTEEKIYIRAKQWLPRIYFLYCDSNGHILPNQTKPTDGKIIDNVSTDEIANDVRRYRNSLLSESDWTQLDDVPLNAEQVQAWRVYRQELRDFPEQINYIDWTAPDWPVPPS